MPAPEIPASMARLPVYKGRPVPHVAAWSSERWGAVRHDPTVGRVAMFSTGRQGRGRPVFGAMNEPRQRAVVLGHRCGVCNSPLEDGAWLPHFDALADGNVTLDLDGTPHEYPFVTEPPCCHDCARWAADGGCPGIAGESRGLVDVRAAFPIVQLVDPSRAPMHFESRFDGEDDPADRHRWGKTARRHGGAVGYVRLALVDTEIVP